MDLEKLLLFDFLGIQDYYAGLRDIPHYRYIRSNICRLIHSGVCIPNMA